MRPVATFPRPALCFFLVMILAAACFQRVSARDKQDKKVEQAEAQALLDKAAALTNIEAAGSQPFVYIANTSWTDSGKTTKGLFGVAWQRADRSREQIAFPGFMQTEVVSKDKLYRARNIAYLPLVAARWRGMFAVSKLWGRLPVSDAVRLSWAEQPRTTSRIDPEIVPKELAAAANFICVTGTTTLPHDTVEFTECIDNANGLPLLFRRRYGKNSTTYLFSDYAAIGEKRFPREITYADSAGNDGEMKASRLGAFTTFSDAEFQPVPDSKAEPWCAEPTFQNPLKREPAYDVATKWIGLRLANLDDPYLFVVINAKGGVDKVFFDGFSPNADQKSVADRVYGDQLPIMYCGKKPVAYETFVRIFQRRPD